MYKGVHDDLNRMVVAQLDAPESQGKFQQTGYFEKYILCSRCDNEVIGKMERYMALLLFGGQSSTPPKFERAVGSDGIKSILITNIDYNKLKLCILSILWGAHISLNKFFKNVDIQNNSERIRRMIIENDANDESEYKIAIVGMRNAEGMIRMVADPSVVKMGEGCMAMFFINGFFYFIDLIPSSGFALFQKHFLTKSGRYDIMI